MREQQLLSDIPRVRRNGLMLFPTIVLAFSSCSPFSAQPIPGPDKQGSGLLSGAALGAGVGAEVTAVSGPGIWAGAGLGALLGMAGGIGTDSAEEAQIRNAEEVARLSSLDRAHRVLRDYYQRSMELHPGRDLFPADLFFVQDSVALRPEACELVNELALLTRRRMPWSRIVVAAYTTSSDPQSTYAEYLTRRRAEELAMHFVRAGIEPRRIAAQSVTLPEPIFVDPFDSPSRYRQAIEIIRLDR